MNKKYELTTDTISILGERLYRTKALDDFGDVKKGDLGGYIGKKENLSHDGHAWVGGNAWAGDNARIRDNAMVSGNAVVCANAHVVDNAWIGGDVLISDNAYVGGNARVNGNAHIGDDAYITKREDYITVGPIGSRNAMTTFYRTKDNVKVTCGCFCGTLNEFAEAVKQTHGGTFYEKEYNAAINLAKIHFRLEESNGSDL